MGLAHLAGKLAASAYTAEMFAPATEVEHILSDPLIAEMIMVAHAYLRCDQAAYVNGVHTLNRFMGGANGALGKPPPGRSRHMPLVYCRAAASESQLSFKRLLRRAGSPRDLEDALMDLDATCDDTTANLRLHLG